jgi:cytochrome c oxidase subunit 3
VHEISAKVPTREAWSGGVRPFGVGSKKLGMWMFIVSDSLTFGALLLAYSYERLANPDWPRPFEMYPGIAKSTGMTVILLLSSLTMVFGVAAANAGRRKAAAKWLVATMILGASFVAIHMTEWATLFREGVTPWSNPWGAPLFGATFFGITGLHMLHVSIGVIYLGVIAGAFGRGRLTPEDVEVSGLYWHFVDLVWMFVFPMLYLMSVAVK